MDAVDALCLHSFCSLYLLLALADSISHRLVLGQFGCGSAMGGEESRGQYHLGYCTGGVEYRCIECCSSVLQYGFLVLCWLLARAIMLMLGLSIRFLFCFQSARVPVLASVPASETQKKKSIYILYSAHPISNIYSIYIGLPCTGLACFWIQRRNYGPKTQPNNPPGSERNA